jgi:NADH:ubiquinone oxidoreductase subunit 6 (subunit J)
MDDRLVPLIIGCALALGSALFVVLPRRPVHGAIALLVHSIALAGLYLVMAAELVAMGQVIVYSGAVVVLFLFVVLLLPKGGREPRMGPRRWLTALVGGGAFLAALAAAVLVRLPPAPGPANGGVAAIGRSLFGSMLVPFELTAPLLLVAIVGAVTLWRRQETKGR